MSSALKAFRTIFREGYKYKKAGVIVSSISAADAIQTAMFDFDEEKRQKHDRISKVMDAFNSSETLLRLATQRPGHYADGIRSDYRSRLYTTNLDEIIEVR